MNLLHERLSPKEFLIRLETNLPRDVMNSQLKTTFSKLQTFRESFIIPLSTQVPESKQIDLNDDYTSLINMIEFKDMFRSVFIDGCNVPRIGRRKDTPVIPDTNERAAYRNFISNCWFILGNNRKIKLHWYIWLEEFLRFWCRWLRRLFWQAYWSSSWWMGTS